MLLRAIALLEETNQRLNGIEQRLDQIEADIEPEPEITDQQTASRLLGLSDRTLQRRRQHWVEGIHWWKEAGSDRPLYNIPLIRDGQRQGFNSPAHLNECKRWAKAQSNQQRRAG